MMTIDSNNYAEDRGETSEQQSPQAEFVSAPVVEKKVNPLLKRQLAQDNYGYALLLIGESLIRIQTLLKQGYNEENGGLRGEICQNLQEAAFRFTEEAIKQPLQTAKQVPNLAQGQAQPSTGALASGDSGTASSDHGNGSLGQTEGGSGGDQV